MVTIAAPAMAFASVPATPECVVLLHGLGRTSRSMSRLEKALWADGYTVANVGYPSRRKSIEDLATEAVGRGLEICRRSGAQGIHFVTHSLGGILVRHYLSQNRIPELGRVVMLAPPNHGSEVVDRLSKVPGFAAVVGPAGIRLGTGPQSIPDVLGPVSFPVGVIAGTSRINPVFSAMIQGPNDGTVSVESARVQGMTDFVAVRASHTFIMRNPQAIRQTLTFLRTGRFSVTPGAL